MSVRNVRYPSIEELWGRPASSYQECAETKGCDLSKDHLLGERVVLHQPQNGFRAAIDSVFLAASVPVFTHQHVLDVGCGTGAAALCLAYRCMDVSVTGIDIDAGLVRIAGKNSAANAMAGRVGFVVEDVSRPATPLRSASFDHVMTNPPYVKPGSGRPPQHPERRMATVETAASLDVWLDYCIRMVRPRGSVTVIHRADRLEDLLAIFSGRLGGITVMPLWPGGSGEKAASRLIIRGYRGSAAPFRLLRGIVLHGPDGRFTNAAEQVLREGAPIGSM